MAETHNGIAFVTLEGAGRNLLNPQNMAATVDALNRADADAGVTGIVVTGAGDTFCGGLDIEAVRAGGDPVEFAGSLVELLKVFPRLTKPVVARVNGDALASGASIVAACDFAVAVPTARVGTFEVSVGIWPMVAQVPLIQRIGARAAMENIG
jgi:enoyl-CoA hydratase/carnithine racemase